MTAAHRVTKLFPVYASAYRNHKAVTDCNMLHGYGRNFEIVFEADTLDRQGFVFDYGELDEVKHWLEEKFDHTTVLQYDDPFLEHFIELESQGVLRLTVLHLVSAEGFAQYVFHYVDEWVKEKTDGRTHVASVTCAECFKNSATYSGSEDLTFSDIHNFIHEGLGLTSPQLSFNL